jgi:hypothetical protein
VDALRALLVMTSLYAGTPPPGVRPRPTPVVAPGPTFADVDAVVAAEVKRLRRQARNLRRAP